MTSPTFLEAGIELVYKEYPAYPAYQQCFSPFAPSVTNTRLAIEYGTAEPSLHLGDGVRTIIKHEGKMNGRFDMAGHFYILLTLLFTVYGQLVLKWQMGQARSMPEGGIDKLFFLLQQFLNPWIMSGFFSAFLASLGLDGGHDAF